MEERSWEECYLSSPTHLLAGEKDFIEISGEDDGIVAEIVEPSKLHGGHRS